MENRRPDPFLEQLEVDLSEGINAAECGKLSSAEDVWSSLYAHVDDYRRREPDARAPLRG